MIRFYRSSDAYALNDIFCASVRTLGARDYSPDQLEEWAGRAPGPEGFQKRHEEDQIILVSATIQDAPAAFAVLKRDGCLDLLYCHPDHAGQGHGRRLIASSVACARAIGLDAIHTQASETARPVFEKAGFIHRQRRDFDLNGVPIHNHAMDRPI